MVPTGHRKLEKVGEFDWPEKVMENPDVYRQSGEKSWKMKIDTDNLDKHCLATDLGFSPDNIIRSELFRKKNCSERDMLGFRTNVKSVLIAMYKKLVQKTPLSTRDLDSG